MTRLPGRLRSRCLGILALCWAFAPTLASATEYCLGAYFAAPDRIAAAIGSNDPALKTRLLGMSDYVKANGLERRFTPPDQWKQAVEALVAGQPRANDFINGFVLEMLLTDRAERIEPRHLTQPYADLDNAVLYFRARGDAQLADYLHRISYGNTDQGDAGLPNVLSGKLGWTEYPARVSVFAVEDVKKLRDLLTEIPEAYAELEAYVGEEDTDAAKAARKAIEGAERERWASYYKDSPPEQGTVDEAIKLASEAMLKEPYYYTDALSAMEMDLEPLRGWLDHAIKTNQAVFFVYPSD